MLRAGAALAFVFLICNMVAPAASGACHLPPNFPPPETNSRAVFCVDANGCCKFSTVQAAVDAVPDNSKKRNIVWINSGVYV